MTEKQRLDATIESLRDLMHAVRTLHAYHIELALRDARRRDQLDNLTRRLTGKPVRPVL